jgi:hypothetical protein
MASEFKSNIITGLAAGVGATLLAPILLPMLARIVKPLTKSIIKTSITAYERGRESFAELSETVDDLVAEAKVELEAGAADAATAASVGALAGKDSNTGQRPAGGAAPSPSGKSGETAPASTGAPAAPPSAPKEAAPSPAGAPQAQPGQADTGSKEGSSETPAG